MDLHGIFVRRATEREVLSGPVVELGAGAGAVVVGSVERAKWLKRALKKKR